MLRLRQLRVYVHGQVSNGLGAPSFATGSLVVALIAMVAPGVFGFYTATRGRKASGWLDA